MGAYSKLLGFWSPLYRSFDCEPTIVFLPDFDQLTVANLVNLILMEEPPDSFVRFNMEQMELFECLNIKLSGLTEIPGDVEIKKVAINVRGEQEYLESLTFWDENGNELISIRGENVKGP